ncbi:adaptin N terminal region-domain-containing protein [Scheffersomyces xylosifermentans]|uniref:adaptin N terminal region-domain-containing protein n=1 Tax=Scheffersomyces xylosifermentans TaxID=1304137 RepID=UPI00315D84B1
MKGLTQFIVDLRNSKDLQEENKRINLEINNIQTKFSSNLNGYQKKKYVCKLIYIYLLGYIDAIDFGLKETFELLNSSAYSEKQLGYVALSVLVNNDKAKQTTKDYLNSSLSLVHQNLIKDLQSNNEDFNCLALQFIGSNFNISESSTVRVEESDEDSAKWLELIDIVYSFVTSPIQKPLTKKKASLALYSLLKLYPQVLLSNSNWIPRLLTLVDDKDYGVAISCIPLLHYIVRLKPQFVKSIIPAISLRLYSIVIENKCPEEYYYYKSPVPWLVVKLLQLIEHFFLLTDANDFSVLSIATLDEQTLNNFRSVVAKSIQNASHPVKGLPNRNSQSSILFQAVSLAVFLDASADAINGAINALMMLLDSNETNTRYLALDALIKLTARSNTNCLTMTDRFDVNLPKIFHLLHDKDISVRRKSLDLLYTICNPSSYNTIISKLLDYFPFSDFTLKSELGIKIAILAERFATDFTWYVTTMLKLLSIGGGSNSNGISYISNEVWERIVQIVVNNESLQKMTCKLVINLLKKPFSASTHASTQPPPTGVSENLIKVAAFVLGEFGEQVSSTEGFHISLQFRLLYDAYFKVSLTTRAMLLTTFLKFLVKFPDEDFVPDIVDLYEIEALSIDLEIQTRSHEYLGLVTSQSNFKLANSVVKPLPAFVQKESHLVNRIGSVSQIVGVNRSKSLLVLAKNINSTSKGESTTRSNTLDDDDEEDDSNPFGDEKKAPTTLSPNWYSGYHRMLHYDAGIFYEDQLIKITYRVLKEAFNIVLKFTIINNSAKTTGTDISGFTVLDLESLTGNQDPNYVLNIKQLPDPTIHDKSTMEIGIKVRNVIENHESPILSLSFMCGGSFNSLNLKFPVLLLKTLSSTVLTGIDEFNKRWQQIGDLLGVKEGECSVKVSITHRYNSSNISRLLTRLGFAVVHSTTDDDVNEILVFGAGILHTQKTNYGVLTTIRSVDQIGKEFEIKVRCSGGGVADVICSTLKEIFEGKF